MRELSAGDARRRRHSLHHSVLLLMAMAALLAYCGWIVAAWQGIVWSVIGGAAMLLLVRRMPPGVVLQALRARALARWEAPALYKILDALCRSAGLEQAPVLCAVAARAPVAFTIGSSAATSIVLSELLLQTVTERERRGILAHEIIHVRNGDLALMVHRPDPRHVYSWHRMGRDLLRTLQDRIARLRVGAIAPEATASSRWLVSASEKRRSRAPA